MSKKGFLVLGTLLALLMPEMALATLAEGSGAGNNAFGTFANILISWLAGNLGYLIAIVAFFGSLVMYAFTHRGSVIIIGLIIAVLVGGGTGLVRLFFSEGVDAFDSGQLVEDNSTL